jgi:hypothetical protein
MIPPAVGGGNNPITLNGRTYTAGAFIDMPDFDGSVAAANGWTIMGYVGTTAQRPTPQDPAPILSVGLKYVDTTLGKLVSWDGSTWRDPVTGLAA